MDCPCKSGLSDGSDLRSGMGQGGTMGGAGGAGGATNTNPLSNTARPLHSSCWAWHLAPGAWHLDSWNIVVLGYLVCDLLHHLLYSTVHYLRRSCLCDSTTTNGTVTLISSGLCTCAVLPSTNQPILEVSTSGSGSQSTSSVFSHRIASPHITHPSSDHWYVALRWQCSTRLGRMQSSFGVGASITAYTTIHLLSAICAPAVRSLTTYVLTGLCMWSERP